MSRPALTAEMVVFGETTFYFHRALPLEAFRILEEMRPGLSSLSEVARAAADADAAGADRRGNAIATAMAAAGKLPPETVSVAMKRLTHHVTFERRDLGAPLKVAADLDSAFKGLTVVQIYEVLVRAFAVNFTDSFDDLRSMWVAVTVDEGDTQGPAT